jgi:hypothetical protein
MTIAKLLRNYATGRTAYQTARPPQPYTVRMRMTEYLAANQILKGENTLAPDRIRKLAVRFGLPESAFVALPKS